MKRIVTCVLAIALILTCLFAVSCGKEEKVVVSRSFLAGYEKTVSMGETEMKISGRVLMNLMSDGNLDLYVSLENMGSLETAHYTGTYTLGENEEFDETITFTYTDGAEMTETVTDAVIIGSVFETPFYMIANKTSNAMKFYETAPVSTEGDVYVGYMTKTGGMGAMVYAYALTLKDEGAFDVSIMQMAGGVMHVWDLSQGTYTVDGDKVTFVYDVMDGEGAVAAEDYTSEGTGFTENGLSVGFNIAQVTVRASDATFIRVK